jgi:hypothetical protein
MRLEIDEIMKRGSASMAWENGLAFGRLSSGFCCRMAIEPNVNREAVSLQENLNGLQALFFSIPTDFPPDERENTPNTRRYTK